MADEVTKLKEALLHANQRADGLALELKLAKEQNIAVQKAAEMEEEAITMRLLAKLEALRKEKALRMQEVEQEEEFLTNTLQKKMDKISQEKSELETRMHELKKQMDQMTSEKNKLCKEKIDLEAALESESEYIVNKLQVQLEKLNSEKMNLLREKSDLQRQVADLGNSVDRLNKDKVKLEQEMEMEEESIVNRLQRQLEALLHNLRLVESKLEAKGLTLKDLGIAPSDLAAPSDALRIYSRSPSSASSMDKWGPSPYSSGAYGSSPGGHGISLRRERQHLSVSGSGSLQRTAGPGSIGGVPAATPRRQSADLCRHAPGDVVCMAK